MHELSVTKNIFAIVQKHAIKNGVKKVHVVNLEIGALSDLQNEWIQRYFDYLSKGSVADGARLCIRRVPAVFECYQCMERFEMETLLKGELICKYCHSNNISLISGKEYTVINMEAE